VNLSPKIVLSLVIILFNFYFISAQSKRGDFRILFYNVENLFDCKNDTLSIDEEFLPEGVRFWNYSKFFNKLNRIAKVVIACGGWESPEIIGLCEIENRFVLEELVNKTSLQKSQYKIIHKDSPDRRGIDVSLLYKGERFSPLSYKYFEVKDRNDSLFLTRDILYVSGVIDDVDTINIFVNHWPSRYGGYLETVDKRALAAATLRSEIDKLFEKKGPQKIIIIGDFNDQSIDNSISKVLGAKLEFNSIGDKSLYNLTGKLSGVETGTIKYQSQWYIYDHIIVSGNLINSAGIYSCNPENAHIFQSYFLFEPDLKYGGRKPFRTFSGFKYNGGYSDHLPVFLDLYRR
jgi:hypothetical protein